MNYIKLLNAFYDQLETNPLSTSAIALWHAFVNVNNKTGWRNEFSVAVSVLRIKSGLSEKSVSNARNELKQKRYLDFKSRKGNQSALYQLIDLSVTVTHKLADSVSDNGSALLKETKRNKTKDDYKAREGVNPFQFYEQEGFGTLSSFVAEQLGSLIDDFGETELIEAMKETRLNGSNSLNYTKKILTNPKPKSKGGMNHSNDVRSYEKPGIKKVYADGLDF